MDSTISALIAVIAILFLILLISAVTVHQIIRDISDDFPEDEASEDDDAETQANNVLDEVLDEWIRASRKFPKFNSAHEGIAVIREEFEELEDEVFSNADKNPDRDANMRAEAIQLAAMALRFITDVTDYQDSFVSEEITQEIPAHTLESLKVG